MTKPHPHGYIVWMHKGGQVKAVAHFKVHSLAEDYEWYKNRTDHAGFYETRKHHPEEGEFVCG